MIAEDRFILDALFAFHKENADVDLFLQVADQKCTSLNWDYIGQQLKTEGVASLFFYYVHTYGLKGLLPTGFYDSLKEQYRIFQVRNLMAIGKAKRVFDVFQERNVRLIVLKGLYLIEHIYPHVATRSLSDIDILIQKSDMATADEALRRLGYIPKDSTPEKVVKNPPGYLASLDYIHARDTLARFHVHWHLINTSVPAYMFAAKVDMGRIWEKAVNVCIADREVATLCPEHTLLYLCEHALRVGHSFDRLVLFSDILLFLKAHEGQIDWKGVWEEGCRMHLDRFLVLALATVEIYTGVPAPEIVQDHLVKKIRWGERIFIKIHREKRRFRGSSYFIYLSMHRNPFSLLRFIFRTLFPPYAILCQRRYIQGDLNAPQVIACYKERIMEVLYHLHPGSSPQGNNSS
jgi:hypothetical protein